MVRPAGMPPGPKPGLLIDEAAAPPLFFSCFSTMIACAQHSMRQAPGNAAS